MKNLFFFLSILFSNQLIGQTLGLNYTSSGTCRSVNASYGFSLKNSVIGLELGYNINRETFPDNSGTPFYKRLYATDPIHHLNLGFFFNRSVFQNLKYIKPFLFYNFSVRYSTSKTEIYFVEVVDTTSSSNDPEDQYLYKKITAIFGPYYWIENIIGIGFNVEIIENLNLQQKFGYGAHFIIGQGDPNANFKVLKQNVEWEFIPFIQFGITYTINKKKLTKAAI